MQNTIYDQVMEAVQNGASFSVDFKSRTLKLNGKDVSLEGELGILEFEDLDQWLDAVEDMYDNYKYSIPSEKSERKSKRSYFKALSAEELERELGSCALSSASDRLICQAELEVFILLNLINGQFNPEELFKRDWFYQGADKSFVMMKDWF